MKKLIIAMIIAFIFGGLGLQIPKENEKVEVTEKTIEEIKTTVDTNNTEQENIIAEDITEESNEIKNIAVEEKKAEVQQEEIKSKQETVVAKQEVQQPKQNTNTNNENTKPKEETKVETKQEKKEDKSYSEVEVKVAEKKQCNGNNHGMSVGNSGQWFETKDQAIATYKAKIKYYGDKWTNNEISDDEYYSNCPYGYEVWSCPYCNKWTINYYYDN